MKVRFGRALTCCVAVFAAAGLSMFVGASEAGAWNITQGPLSVSAVHLNKVAVSDITVAPGATISVKFKYTLAANSGCPGCFEQIQEGYSNVNPNRCLANTTAEGGTNFFGSESYSGTEKFKETAPAAAGSYFLAVAFAEDFNCFQTESGWWNGAPNPNTQFYAHVTVT
jgi:hypothetical protein